MVHSVKPPEYPCKSCGSKNVEDTTTYNDAVFSSTPKYRFKCLSCGHVSWYYVNEVR